MAYNRFGQNQNNRSSRYLPDEEQISYSDRRYQNEDDYRNSDRDRNMNDSNRMGAAWQEYDQYKNNYFDYDRNRYNRERENNYRPATNYGSFYSETDHTGRGPKGYTRSDSRIEEDVNETLEFDRHIDASEIEVKVDNGIVTLSGSVDSRHAKRHAEDIIENIKGVKDVRNQITIDQSLFQKAKELLMGESSGTSESKSKTKSGRTSARQ